ncbi:MAG: hypothetical protein ACRD59_09965 [Candidatus Acidiferrales bacterium]
MNLDSWFATSPAGRTTKYAYKELSDGTAAISATADGCTTMILQRNLRAPMTRAQVEAAFEANLATNHHPIEHRSGACLAR